MAVSITEDGAVSFKEAETRVGLTGCFRSYPVGLFEVLHPETPKLGVSFEEAINNLRKVIDQWNAKSAMKRKP